MWDLELRAWVLGFRGLGKPKKIVLSMNGLIWNGNRRAELGGEAGSVSKWCPLGLPFT